MAQPHMDERETTTYQVFQVLFASGQKVTQVYGQKVITVNAKQAFGLQYCLQGCVGIWVTGLRNCI